ncbi:DUF6919 domain-containing protein [Streptomyces gardneri]|uniref:DUF6919 domain-containing protein n=1 Tax=Streptomyces gardneri TaxID=66892 RepID=UPI0036A664DF
MGVVLMGSVWRDACSINDLGRNMAGWLEGRVPAWPGYDGPFGQEETNSARHLVPTLVALNRAGFVTVNSQPGEDAYHDGRHWRQRACVDGVVHDRSPLLRALLRLNRGDITVVRGWPMRQHAMTELDGESFTTYGGFRLGRNHAAREWRGVGRQALRELREHGAVIHLHDTVWGRDNTLWPALMGAVR